MVSFKRKPVQFVPPPPEVVNGIVHPETPVYRIEQTGELFLSQEAYTERLTFYSQKQFTSSGKQGLDFFSALASEHSQSQQIQSTFPHALKKPVLRSVNFRVENRLDDLVSSVFERFSHRYFVGERPIVVVGGEAFQCNVVGVFPPAEIRAMLPADAQSETSNGSTSRSPGRALSLADMSAPAPDRSTQHAEIAHSVGTDLSVDSAEAREKDDPAAYLYTVQIISAEGKFDASTTEAKPQQLSRDKAIWSKTVVKRFLRDSLERDSPVGSPWMLKDRIAKMYEIENTQSEEQKAQVAEARKTRTSRRKRTRGEVEAEEEPEPISVPDVPVTITAPKRQARGPADDLDLDPTTIFETLPEDADKTKLPSKGSFKRDLPVDSSLCEPLLAIWNFFNVFGGALNLTNFTLDAFVDALKHNTLEPRSLLLAEMHAATTIPVIIEGLRISNTVSVASTGPMPESAADRANNDGLTVEERQKVIRRALVYVRKWDRSTRLKAAEGRLGWERHAIGAMVSKGGIFTMPDLPRLLTHLLAGLPEEKSKDGDEDEDELAEDASMQVDKPATSSAAPGAEGSTPVPPVPAGPTPAELYLTLPIKDKLIILEYLIDLVLHGKYVRQYIDEAENICNEIREERTQIMKERKSALISKAAMERREAKAEAAGETLEEVIPTPEPSPSPPPKEPTPPPTLAAVENGNGRVKAEVASDFDELDSNPEIDELADDAVTQSAPTSAAAVPVLEEPTEPEVPRTAKEKLADKLEDIQFAEEANDREQRRWSQVGRVTPLGQDRFYCRYHWVDGIGHMELIAQDGTYIYGAGRLFIQGPKPDEWKLMTDKLGGDDKVIEKRKAEEGIENPLGVDEWAYIDEEEEIGQLIAHLNPKGRREGPLRIQLEKWRAYIIGGADNRREDLSLEPMLKPPNLDPRRKGRPPKEPKAELNKQYYLGYRNYLATAPKESKAKKAKADSATPAPGDE